MNDQAADERFMRRALELAKEAARWGEVPVGAVVVENGRIVGEGFNRRETWRDGTAHAEMLAIEEANRRLGGWRLTNCVLYVTLEPCPMCAGAIVLSRLQRLVYGATDAKGGAVASKVRLLEPGLWNHTPQITSGILADDCAKLLTDFFRKRRPKRREGEVS
ncbi:tRNA adenosine(34) deaminase TadA [Alicyclobacillus acidocaldarius]|uniref:tRNA-specific adenosine deaminase n=1 Tax=Alicyclobacillus acidocaldarius (strain Tc-4-1) TaxID=1048834 RepID=F8IIE5_ALIAT|nr:tRNA adenosine(34) deaminase TadA [Alicyclobacillus acidocaldarius]AEJ42104.1 CMP/dCMP deaminase zinc-binding protein [Alicyclobacillus acidocaldarius subsp. acidocaldarius Tc-4-1]